MSGKLSLILLLLLTVSLSAEVKIAEIQFQGNAALQDRDLLQQLTLQPGSFLDMEIVKADCTRLMNYYEQRGFSRARIDFPEIIPLRADAVRITYKIEEYEKNQIHALVLTGNRYFPLPKLQELLGFTDKTTWSFREIHLLLSQITDLYTSRSYLFASVSLDSLQYDPSGYTAFVSISEGKLCRITNYRFEGNKTTKPSILLKLSGLDQVSMITPAVIQQAEENIRSKEYIRNCTIYPLDEKTLLLSVEEDKMTRVAGVIGYNTSDVQSKQRLSGNLQFQFLNLWGSDRNLSFSWYQLKNQHQTMELAYHDSGPFRFPLAGDFAMYREQADSTWIKSRLSLGLYYYLLYHQVGLNLATDDVFPGSRRPVLISNDHEKTVGVFWRFTNVDYSPNPTMGMTARVTLDRIFVSSDSSSTDRNTVTFSWNNYHTVARKFVWFLGMNGKHLSDRNAPYYRLFRLGGFNTLRGFTEDSFSGWRIGWVNNEFRLRTGRDSRIHLFLDYGYVEYRRSGKDERYANLWGTGLGLRIKTRLGVVGIDYAVGYDGKEWKSPLDGIVHFGLDTKF